MAKKYKASIFVVDDDSCIRDLVSLTLESSGYKCTCFDNADSCLAEIPNQKCDLLMTDVRMPEKGGIELLIEVKRKVPWMPVLVMTSYAEIPTSVKAVKAGAFNFIEKPLDGEMLLEAVETALKENDLSNILRGKLLTKTEAVILNLILQGRSNKGIAHILHRSVRTIEDHRNHIMRKLDVDNVVDLVKRATAMGMMDLSGSDDNKE
jgi:FixJ family two-component response regulator